MRLNDSQDERTKKQNFQLLTIALISIAALASGCETFGKKELTKINKDWNRLIRASHIHPIYPLSQDIQPGDIFLTDTHIEENKAWEKEGYLKLDRHIARIHPTNFMRFYERSFATGSNALPNLWIKDNSWSNAPAAAFPTYSFSVKQGGGASVALPISGVPVALGLMGARSASGFVTIGDARTYGIDESSLLPQVQAFVSQNQRQLQQWISAEYAANVKTNSKPRYYLQVVTRVYATGKVTVSMLNDSSKGGSVSGGVPKDVPIPTLSNTNAAANYSNIVAAVNANLSSAVTVAGGVASVAPGGTLKFSAVSSRSVSMDETFPKPVVIGYVGFSWPLEIEPLPPGQAAIPGIVMPRFLVHLKEGGVTTFEDYLSEQKR